MFDWWVGVPKMKDFDIETVQVCLIGGWIYVWHYMEHPALWVYHGHGSPILQPFIRQFSVGAPQMRRV